MVRGYFLAHQYGVIPKIITDPHGIMYEMFKRIFPQVFYFDINKFGIIIGSRIIIEFHDVIVINFCY